MRVVLVVDEFPEFSQGFLIEKFCGLLKAGVDAHVLRRRPRQPLVLDDPRLTAIQDVRQRIHQGGDQRSRWKRRLRGGMAAVQHPGRLLEYRRRARAHSQPVSMTDLATAAAIRKLRPDTVHVEFGLFARPLAPVLVPDDAPLVVTFRGADICYVGLDNPRYYEPVWQRAAGYHFRSRGIRRRAEQRGVPATVPSAIIPPSIDTSFFDPRQAGSKAPADGPLRVVTVARLHWKKGLEFGVQAVALAAEAGCDLDYVIVGSGDRERLLEQEIAALGVGDRVHLVGQRDRGGVRETLAGAHVFLFPSVAEGFGNGPLEAQAMTLPAVVTDAEGLPEAVAHGETGFVVPRRNPAAIAERLQELASDPTLRRQFGHAGRERAAREFTLQREITGYLDLYGQVIR